ncbi:hypothetical protein MCC01967_21210 [Bifidobacteriaceae bacterium MCC01967]|nr:hypothetical protein MCC01967_21210 [Bifidobacteriaceae bacterium MCC01967]GDZ65110.1 hypothetical protein MCC02038_19500 [Bifidobacteriaceae bacterium MCC02038]
MQERNLHFHRMFLRMGGVIDNHRRRRRARTGMCAGAQWLIGRQPQSFSFGIHIYQHFA